MIRPRRLVTLLIIALLPFALLASPVLWVKATYPTDDELSAQFLKHRSELEQLVTLINANHIQFIDDERCEPTVDAAVQSRARSMMETTGIKYAAATENVATLVTYTWGLSVSGIYRGFRFDPTGSDVRTGPVGEVIQRHKQRFVRIADGWFIYTF